MIDPIVITVNPWGVLSNVLGIVSWVILRILDFGLSCVVVVGVLTVYRWFFPWDLPKDKPEETPEDNPKE